MTAYVLWTGWALVMWKLTRTMRGDVMVEATIAPETVPCGIHTMVDEKDERGWRKSVACGGTCAVESRTDTMVYYKCQSCGFRTARRSDGSPLQAWDGLLKDGTPYEGSCVDESDWRL